MAEEVRNLAQRSAEASRNTAGLIEDSQRSAENGVAVSHEVENITKDIIESIEKVTDIMESVSDVNTNHAQGTDQISSNISHMEQITQSTAASSEELVATSDQLADQARQLNNVVATLVSIVGSGGHAATSAPQTHPAPEKDTEPFADEDMYVF